MVAIDEMTKEVVEVERGGDDREVEKAETVTAEIATDREIATSPDPVTGGEVVIEIAVGAAEIKTAIVEISREIGIKSARVAVSEVRAKSAREAASEVRAKIAIAKANATEAKAERKMVTKAQRRTRATIARIKMLLTQPRTRMGTIATMVAKKRLVKMLQRQSQRKMSKTT